MSNMTEPHFNPGLGGGGGFSGDQWLIVGVVALILLVLLGLFVWARLHED